MKRIGLVGAVSLILVCASTAYAQGNSAQAPGKKKNATGAAAAAPSRNELSAIAVAPVPGSTSATPLAWVDDASLLAPGMVSLSLSAMRWSGGGVSEVDAPVVDAALGLTSRVQISASVPRVVGGADPEGAVGGVGTSFFATKIAVYQHPRRPFKAAVTPTLQVLGEGVVAALEPGEGRVRWGLPVSAEISSGSIRLYGGGGYFSPGLWFGGAAVSAQASSKVFVSGGFSRAWRHSEIPDLPMSERDRKELSGGVAYVLHPSITVFGSVGRTIHTLVENGAGTSLSGGVSFSFATSSSKP